ncbi:transient receptor potential cation channel subfamily M member 2-like [Ambystoma mexicanum]|uniref:transient receptor potential cation channel subfamily M member 2-like n=1 Tax=Ambystoma mexicanum TaxID=8296 RepID=UPI0037E733C0
MGSLEPDEGPLDGTDGPIVAQTSLRDLHLQPPSKPHGDRWKTARSQFVDLDHEKKKLLNSWFLQNIKKKQCVHFRRSAKSSDEGKEVCGCGYRRDQHSEQDTDPPYEEGLEWNPEEQIREEPTDAYGDLTFTGLGKSVMKYVRVSNGTASKVLYEMMTRKWNLSAPNLLISVTGGTKNFSMKARLKNLFNRGLIKAAQTTGAWIITGGTHSGVTKHVGEAVRDFSMTSSQMDSDIIAIGIANWGLLHNRDSLISKVGAAPAQYTLDEENQGKLCCLDSNHSHFMLVDDGTHGRPGVEAPLRTRLEKFISQQSMERGGVDLKIPVVRVVLEGGPETLDMIHTTMTENTPCVIVEGSGGIADVIAEVGNLNSSKITIALVQDKLRYLFPEAFDSFTEIHIIEWTKKIQDIVRMSQLLTIFREDKDGAQDVDVAILQALLKASARLDHHGHENWDYQLKLAVSWNRVDIAKSDIFTDDKQWKPSDLYPVMTIALIDNKPDFVRLFLDHGVSLKEFLTWDALKLLYNNMEPSSPVYSKLEKLLAEEEQLPQPKGRSDIQLHHVARVIKELLGEFTELLYPNFKSSRSSIVPQINIKVNFKISILGKKRKTHPKEAPPLPVYPLRDLLIWSILQNREELAEIAWSQDQDCIVAALACSKILKELSKEADEADNSENMLALAALYEERAVGVFSECYRKNEIRAEELLTRISPAWGKTTCLQLAREAKAMRFMSQGGVQILLTKIWWGRLSVDNGLVSVLLCMLLFPLIYTGLVTFRTNISSSDGLKKPQPLSCIARLSGFFAAPVVVFYWNVISYIGFLWLFAHVLMIDFQTLPSWRECLLYVWIFSVLCEELRQCFYDPEGTGFKKRCLLYISKFWNQMDALGLVLFITGLACRFFSITLYLGRILLSLDFIIFCIRLMHIFTVSKVLGPKIIMMQRMMKDIFFFLFLLAVWIVSYGVAKQAILVHNEDRLDWILRSVVYQPFLTLFGQIPTDVERSGFDVTKCSPNATDQNLPKCAYADDAGNPLFPEWLTIILLCLYLLFANILIINLLIAMFSYTFAEVQDHTDQIWKFQRHDLIEEYNNRPPAPPPFILLSHLHFLVKYVMMRRPARGQKHLMRTLDESESAALLSWESYMKENYLQSQQYKQQQSTDQKIRDTSEKVSAVVNLLEIDQEKRSRMMERKLALLEVQMIQSTKALSWIIEVLSEKGFGSKANAPVLVHSKSLEEGEAGAGEVAEGVAYPYHVNARELLYPDSNVHRFPVPDEMVPWQVEFLIYDPPFHIAERDDRGAFGPLTESPEHLLTRQYNALDGLIDLRSCCGTYMVKDGLPLNPMGRTGIRGIGSLRCYGPNHSLHPVLTRWRRNINGSISRKNSKKMLEILAVKPVTSEHWALPGGTLAPGEKLPSKLKEILKEEFWHQFEAMQVQGTEVYRGYLDDPRNTDNAWIETLAINVHLESAEKLDQLTQNILDREPEFSIRWQVVDQKIPLFANQKEILRKATENFRAHY